MNEELQEHTPSRTWSFREFAKRVAFIAALVILTVLIAEAAQAFLLLFLAILVALAFRGPSNWIAARTPLTGRWAVVSAVLAILVLLGAFVFFSAPSFNSQIDELQKTIPASLERIQGQLNRYQWGHATVVAANNADDYLPEPSSMVRRIAGVFSTTFGAIGAFVVVVFLGICMALEPKTYTRGLLKLVPLSRRERISGVLHELTHVLSLWLFAILISMSIVGLLTGIGLWALGIPMAFVLAIFAFLMAFIPNVGPIISAAPAVLLGLADSPQKALFVILLYLAVQTVESYLITPFVQRETVSLPPALTGFLQLVLVILAGLPGVIVAAPLAAAGIVITRRLYVEDELGDVCDNTP